MTHHHLLWLDLETTGLDVEHDEIVEIGCLLSTPDLKDLSTFAIVVKPSDAALRRLERNDIVREMHRKSGLLEVIPHGVNLGDANHALAGWLDNHHVTLTLTLAGSGVGHHDLNFVRRYMPELAAHLDYFVIDVGVIRRAHEMWTGQSLTDVNEQKTHRALDDVRCHFEEAQSFSEMWQHHSLV